MWHDWTEETNPQGVFSNIINYKSLSYNTIQFVSLNFFSSQRKETELHLAWKYRKKNKELFPSRGTILVLFLVFEQDNDQSNENCNKIEEQFKCIPYHVIISRRGFLDDQLSVKHDVSAKHQKASVQKNVENKNRTEENVQESEENKCRQSRT